MTKAILVTVMAFAAAIPAFAQDSGWIGVSIVDRPEGGVLVRSVEPNSPAERAGIRANDIIVRYNGQEVVGVLQLTRLVTETPVGRTVEIIAQRDNKEQTFKVTTEQSRFGELRIRTPDLSGLRGQIARAIPRFEVHTSVSVSQNGIHVDDMSPQLREYFGVKSAQGVLVTSVDADTPAAKAGLRAGDVIIAIDGRTISTPTEFSREVRTGPTGTRTYRIVREKQEQELQVAP